MRVLRAEERRSVQATFGAADAQVRRDHLLSHVIAAVARSDGEWVLYGGTGLARTHLPAFRLSEDLDLLAYPRRAAVAESWSRSSRGAFVVSSEASWSRAS